MNPTVYSMALLKCHQLCNRPVERREKPSSFFGVGDVKEYTTRRLPPSEKQSFDNLISIELTFGGRVLKRKVLKRLFLDFRYIRVKFLCEIKLEKIGHFPEKADKDYINLLKTSRDTLCHVTFPFTVYVI